MSNWVTQSVAPTDDLLRDVLTSARRVVVLGAHTDVERAAFYVPEYLVDNGYQVRGVNPAQVGQSFFGSPIVATLAEAGAADVVDVFRRSDALPGHLAEILAYAPKLVWLQTGIRHAEFAASLRNAGIAVIEDRCMLADHQKLGLPPVHI